MTILLACALVLPPLVLFRGRTLAAFAATTGSVAFLAWLAAMRLPLLEPRPGWALMGAAQLAIVALFLANGTAVRWSASRAAIVAGIVYLAVIPAMLVTPPDGDEPYYLLVTESIVEDGDLDLANQYATLAGSPVRRPDLAPFPGDPKGPGGEQYSRHEPFLSLLMAPGFVLGGVFGAIATIALFGALLVRSTIRWMEEEGIEAPVARAVFPFLAFAPPVLFFATRSWPEVPAAFFFVEAVRGLREDRPKRWAPALAGLVLLKLRFVLAALGLVAAFTLTRRGDRRAAARRWALALVLAAVPLAVMWTISGDATNVHSWREVLPGNPADAVRGAAGLVADGMSGLAFQAPLLLLGLVPLFRWRQAPAGFRLAAAGSLLYLVYLVPRNEWFGGWAPPLRYVAFLAPVLALGAAWAWPRIPRAVVALASAWTVGLVAHGIARPWRLFHIFNGENAVGEWLSQSFSSDFSRLFPSFVRPNTAAWPGFAAAALLLAWIAFRRAEVRRESGLALALAALLLAGGFAAGRRPAARVELEDAHVRHAGGELYPERYTMMRTAYRGGWVLQAGDSASFLAREGEWTLHFITGLGAMIEIDGHAYQVRPAAEYQTARIVVGESGPVTLRCVSGAINVDRMERHD